MVSSAQCHLADRQRQAVWYTDQGMGWSEVILRALSVEFVENLCLHRISVAQIFALNMLPTRSAAGFHCC